LKIDCHNIHNDIALLTNTIVITRNLEELNSFYRAVRFEIKTSGTNR